MFYNILLSITNRCELKRITFGSLDRATPSCFCALKHTPPRFKSERGRKWRLAICNSSAYITRPCDELFEELLNRLQEVEASFERLSKPKRNRENNAWAFEPYTSDSVLPAKTYLKQDPKPSTKSCNRPRNEPKKEEPQDREDGVLWHIEDG